MTTRSPRPPREAPKPKPVTAAYLRTAAMHYLSARSASISMLRQTLQRRAKRRSMVKQLDEETALLIEKAIAELAQLKLVDDQRFAENRAVTLARKGLSKRRIGLGLKLKGVDAATIDKAIAADVDDLSQARLFVARKKLGTFRRGGATPETRKKDLSALARAGFSYGLSVKALDTVDEE